MGSNPDMARRLPGSSRAPQMGGRGQERLSLIRCCTKREFEELLRIFHTVLYIHVHWPSQRWYKVSGMILDDGSLWIGMILNDLYYG
jgi:hypothetical protein